MKELTPEDVIRWKKQIDVMTQEDMARLWRFAESGHPLFVTGSELYKYFQNKFKGFTVEISKKIGWGR